MPFIRVLITPEEKKQGTKELKRQYYIENRDRLLEYQNKYKASLEITYTPAQKRAIQKYQQKLRAKKLETSKVN